MEFKQLCEKIHVSEESFYEFLHGLETMEMQKRKRERSAVVSEQRVLVPIVENINKQIVHRNAIVNPYALKKPRGSLT